MNKIEESLKDRKGQDLAADETALNEGRDASQEEIHHLIVTAGWTQFLPEVFSDELSRQSALTKAWQNAEDKALYAYDDPTCDDSCRIIEFFYLVTAAYLGPMVDVARNELRVKTQPDLRERLPDVVAIMESATYSYPKNIWPDGEYNRSKNIIFSD